jgi:hypothetical protein
MSARSKRSSEIWSAWAAERDASDPLRPEDAAAARETLISDPPFIAKVNEVTGLVHEGPWRQVRAIEILARLAPDEETTRDLVLLALARHGTQLSIWCWPEVGLILRDDAQEPLLAVLEVHSMFATSVAMALEHADELKPQTLLALQAHLDRHTGGCHDPRGFWHRWIRRLAANDAHVVERLKNAARGSAPDIAGRLQACIDAADVERDDVGLAREWNAVKGRLPAWSSDVIRVATRVPRDDGQIPFLIADGVRRFAPCLDFQVFVGEHLLRGGGDETLRAWELPLVHSADRSLLLLEVLEHRWTDAFARMVDPARFAALVGSMSETEAVLRVPRSVTIEGRHGPSRCEIDGPHPRQAMFRIGGLGLYELDRPFAIAIWDRKRERALEVGVVASV